MTFTELVSKALPGADAEHVEYVLWNRTPFPFETSPRLIFKWASGYRRACANKIELCELCSRPSLPDKWTCQACDNALSGE